MILFFWLVDRHKSPKTLLIKLKIDCQVIKLCELKLVATQNVIPSWFSSAHFKVDVIVCMHGDAKQLTIQNH